MFSLNKLVAASLQVSWEDWMKSETSTKFYLIKCKPNDIQYWKPTRKYGRSQCKYGSMVLVSVLWWWWWCLVVRRVWLSCHDAIASVSTAPVLLAVAASLLLCWTLLLPLQIPYEVILTFDIQRQQFQFSSFRGNVRDRFKIQDTGAETRRIKRKLLLWQD